MSDTSPPRRQPRLVIGARWILAWGFRLLTRPGRRAAAHVVTWLWFDVVRYRRRLVLKNLAIAFPEWTDAKRRRVGRKSVWNLCYSGAETFILPFLTRENLSRWVVIEGREQIDGAFARGRGAFLLVPHLGNVELLMAAGSLAGIRHRVIAKRFKNAFFDALIFGLRESFGTGFIEPHSSRTAFVIMQTLRSNEAVGFVIDQFMKKAYGVESTFFGQKTTTAYGLALFALKTRAPVIPAHGFRGPDNRMHICFGPEISCVEDEDRDRAIQATTQRYNHVMEDMIRAHPEDWMWVHNRWKPIR